MIDRYKQIIQVLHKVYGKNLFFLTLVLTFAYTLKTQFLSIKIIQKFINKMSQIILTTPN